MDGQTLRALCESHGLSLAILARHTRYSRSSWARWLSGARPVTAEALVTLAEMLGIDAGELLSAHGFAASLATAEGDGARRRVAVPYRRAEGDGGADGESGSGGDGNVGESGGAAGDGGSGSTTSTRGPRFRSRLPPDTRYFTGRGAEVAEIEALVDVASSALPGAVVISAINGMGGVGKTALAVHAAHRVRREFPDGALFLDLRAHVAGVEPLGVDAALDQLLGMLDVPPQSVPPDLDERAARYRSALADSRTLIVLDNVASAGQIRALLPGTPGCLVLITSRARLAGLDDAYRIELGSLAASEAIELLVGLAGSGRISADDPAVAELVELCGGLPLALRIAAARLRHRAALTVGHLVEELAQEGGRLTGLTAEDRGLAAVFTSSYRALGAAERRAFRMLGAVPGAQFDTFAAASLLGCSHDSAEDSLAILADQSLVIDDDAGRYRLHDLLRAFAQARQADEGDAGESADGVDRLLDYYHHTAWQAHQVSARRPPRVQPTFTTVPEYEPVFADREDAIAWYRVEFGNLVVAVETAMKVGKPTLAAHLPRIMFNHLWTYGPWTPGLTLFATAAQASRAIGDMESESAAANSEGSIRMGVGDHVGARVCLERSLELCRTTGDVRGQAAALGNLAIVRSIVGDFGGAIAMHEQALELHLANSDLLDQHTVHRNVGMLLTQVGRHEEARDHIQQSIEIAREMKYETAVCGAQLLLGTVAVRMGEYAEARRWYEGCIEQARTDRLIPDLAEALALYSLVLRLDGDCEAAERARVESIELYQGTVDKAVLAFDAYNHGSVLAERGELAEAAAELERSVTLYEEGEIRDGVAEALNGLAAVRCAAGEIDRAHDGYTRALAMAREAGSPYHQAAAHEGLGTVAVHRGDKAEAAAEYAEALGMLESMRNTPGMARLAGLLKNTDMSEDGATLAG